MKYMRLQAHLNAAQGYTKLSHATRLKVAAVLVKDDRIISVGYNGMPSGGSNQCEVFEGTKLITKPEVVHAEANVISFAAKNGVSTDGCTLISTHSPCFECAKLIIQSGIKEVYYETEYRITDSLRFLREYNIKVERIKDEGKSAKKTWTKKITIK